jgi:dTDP-4-amino-4,6-dideoxygalactose transaminase
VPSFTFAATVNAIVWCGLTPVFADVDPSHWHLRPNAVAEAIRDRGEHLATVLACSTFGTPPPPVVREEWEHLCSTAGIPLLVDSAAGFGAIDESGVALGGQGDAELFSFHATKPFAIGEGGAVTTRDEELAERIARLTNFGLDADRVVSGGIGLNAKLSEIQAATGLAMLDRIDDVLHRRRMAAAAARGPLEQVGYTFQHGCERSTWQFIPALAPDGATRDRVLALGGETGIQIRSYFAPLHTAPAFDSYPRAGALSTTLDISSRVISLPLSNDQSPEDAERVVSCAIRGAVRLYE